MPDDALRPLISAIRRVYYTVRKREALTLGILRHFIPLR